MLVVSLERTLHGPLSVHKFSIQFTATQCHLRTQTSVIFGWNLSTGSKAYLWERVENRGETNWTQRKGRAKNILNTRKKAEGQNRFQQPSCSQWIFCLEWHSWDTVCHFNWVTLMYEKKGGKRILSSQTAEAEDAQGIPIQDQQHGQNHQLHHESRLLRLQRSKTSFWFPSGKIQSKKTEAERKYWNTKCSSGGQSANPQCAERDKVLAQLQLTPHRQLLKQKAGKE